MNRSIRVVVQVNADEVAKVDELRGGASRAAFFRGLLRDAGAPAGGEVASHRESLEILTALARDGKMPAAIALERALRSLDQPAEDVFAELDRMAGRR